MKICSKCNVEKNNTEFYRHKQTKDGLFPSCKICIKNFYNSKYANDKMYRKKKAIRQSERWRTDSEYRVDQARRQRGRAKERYKTDINFKLSRILRVRLNEALKNSHKSGSAVEDLGCSITEFKIYIQMQFQPGMSWNNWTTDGWHIDHKIPLSAFDLSDSTQLKKATHYTNLQPMWAVDNIKKRDSICL